jgi:hypothetical protein
MSLTTAAGKRRVCARGDARGTSRTSGVHEFFFILSSPSSSTFVIVRVAHRARGIDARGWRDLSVTTSRLFGGRG